LIVIAALPLDSPLYAFAASLREPLPAYDWPEPLASD